MRLFTVLLFLSPLLGARAFSLDSRGSGLRRLDVRSTTDVCASVMYAPIIVNFIGEPQPVGEILDSGSTFLL